MLKYVWLLLLPFTATANDLAAQVTAANSAFDRGDYTQALAVYQDIADAGHVNGHVYYNMGVIFHRLQRTGEAMAAFLAARHYLPRDPDVVFNLRFIQDKIKDNLTSIIPPKFYDVIGMITDYLTRREIAVTALVLGGLSLLLFAFYLFYRQVVFLFKLGILMLVLAVLAIIFLQTKSLFAEHWGAIITKSTQVYSGPGTDNTTLFILHEGAPFIVEKETNAYLRIRLSDGKKGWVNTDTARSYM